MTRTDVCERVFYSVFEIAIFALVVILITWWAEGQEEVLQFSKPPGYQIKAITNNGLDVQWQKVKLVNDCHGSVYPAFVGEYGAESLASYPLIAEAHETTFTRRYVFPSYFPPGAYELRLSLVAYCNPVFPARQIIRVPFRLGRPDVDSGKP